MQSSQEATVNWYKPETALSHRGGAGGAGGHPRHFMEAAARTSLEKTGLADLILGSRFLTRQSQQTKSLSLKVLDFWVESGREPQDTCTLQ